MTLQAIEVFIRLYAGDMYESLLIEELDSEAVAQETESASEG